MSTKANAGQYIDTTKINYRDRNFRKGKRGSQQGHAHLCMLQLREEKMAENQVHLRVYFPLTTEICLCLVVNNL